MDLDGLVFGIPGWMFGTLGATLAVLIPVIWWPRKQEPVSIKTPRTSSYIPKEPHRHRLKLTNFILLSDLWPMYVGTDEHAWQCNCGVYTKKSKVKMKEEMMPQWANVDQVWPG
ncbi:membrane protein [Arthrobacter phage Qui]|uniref:Membrane protein n=1 Tax=Arthrobacter phage Qui TaxID=2603260 RepID=A0A5B8WGS7_9CAUD|nr:membrane protein [Arthrobacter phage Qui]QED11723.1 membrane protein [Arthrobacter phage Qui]QOC56555.1 hypothetical protein SEA_PAELLA_236 [Arthrobacter phage Paella]